MCLLIIEKGWTAYTVSTPKTHKQVGQISNTLSSKVEVLVVLSQQQPAIQADKMNKKYQLYPAEKLG